MAAEIIKNHVILWGGHNIQSRVSAVRLERGRDALDDTTLGLGTRSNTPGLISVKGQIEGRYETADNHDLALHTAQVADNLGISFPHSTTEGDIAHFLQAMQASYTPLDGEVGGLQKFSASIEANNSPIVYGTLMDYKTAVSTTGNGTGRQLGTLSAAQRMYAILHVWNVVDPADVLGLIVESDDNSGFTSATTRITFSNVSAIGSQFTYVAGAIGDDYWRVRRATVSGAAPSFNYAVILGRK